MPITEEQAQKIKEHLLRQLANFPDDKREQIKDQVGSMTATQVEEFVEENKLTHLGEGKCIFCTIIQGKTPSIKIAEDEKNIAILEINPLSKGHALIVPKKHDDKIYSYSTEFAKKVADRIKERLGPKEIKAEEINIMGHQLIEVIPLYGDETEKKPTNPEELKIIQEEIIRPEPEQENMERSELSQKKTESQENIDSLKKEERLKKDNEKKESTEKREAKKEELLKLKARIPR